MVEHGLTRLLCREKLQMTSEQGSLGFIESSLKIIILFLIKIAQELVSYIK
jgi:hypothetical protein